MPSTHKSSDQILSKQGQPIEVGDHVFTKIRGGSHEGNVEKIVRTEEEAEAEGVKHPPKVLFTDQHGRQVAHNPGTLDIIEDTGKQGHEEEM